MGTDPAVADARIILDWIRARGGASFNARDLYTAKRHDFPKADDTRPGLRVLLDRGYIRERKSDAPGKQGRPALPVYDVNPAVLSEGAA